MTLRDEGRLPPTGADAILIWTRRGNAGDHLIAEGCERFLRDRGVTVWRSDGSLEDAVEAQDRQYLGDFFASYRGMVTFAGGGNIGIYPDNALVRAGVIERLGPRHRCLVFSQSARGPEPALADPRVTVWCRDAVSRGLLASAGVRTELAPDMALYMHDLIVKAPGGAGRFQIRRTRGGDAETIEHGVTCDGPATDLTLHNGLPDIVATLTPYRVVLSDRLHGGLIAMMMRKQVVLLPVGYHKIRAFYDTWLRGAEGIAFVETPAQLPAALARLTPPAGHDLGALFREYAIPAFERFLLS